MFPPQNYLAWKGERTPFVKVLPLELSVSHQFALHVCMRPQLVPLPSVSVFDGSIQVYGGMIIWLASLRSWK
jgi:hypothetical protein